MTGKRRRLPPVSDTTRELWVFSGNQCAFPGCGQVLLDADGHWNCEVAHIHGVKPTSARGDHDLTDEQLRESSNLVLMCPNHHTKIDDKALEAKYPVEVVLKMKTDHEKKYRTALRGLAAIVDGTAATTVSLPVNLVGLLGCDDEESIRKNLESAKPFIDALVALPAPLRQVVSLILTHADVPGSKSNEPIIAGIKSLEAAALNDPQDLRGRLGELEAKGLLQLDHEFEGRPIAILVDPTARTMGWDLFTELYRFAHRSADPRAVFRAVIDDLTFTILDDESDHTSTNPKKGPRPTGAK